MKLKQTIILLVVVACTISVGVSQDTLKVMTYNVLHYGDGCQGSNMALHRELKTIVQYANPDLVGMVKLQSISLSATDLNGLSRVGFADSILNDVFNAAYANKYDHCPVVNFSHSPDGDMDLLFYNTSKLGFLSVTSLCTIQEDFNLYKLYYKDVNLPKTKDTTFLYFILNHTVSGTASSGRDAQDSTIVNALARKFVHLPNLISMGDFNTHSSGEPGYQLLTASADANFLFSDPPYFPDQKLSYPSDWSGNAGSFTGYLNTSTRAGLSPNACGTSGGAKGWYLHMLLSPWIVNNKNYVKYVPGSYNTLGNDGRRVNISVNDSITTGKNSAVPQYVADALFQFSDKYPVTITLVISPNTSGTSLPDPTQTITGEIIHSQTSVVTGNPVGNQLQLYFSPELVGRQASLHWFDLSGRLIDSGELTIAGEREFANVNLPPGIYVLRVAINGVTEARLLVKQ